MTFHFDCVFYYVSDMDRALRFYRDVLGLKLVSRDYVTRFEVDGVLFELVPVPHHGSIQGNGNARLCLGVYNVEEALAELQRKGVRTSKTQTKEGVLGSLTDPDGNEVCLWQMSA
jgi:catechol 2,3-dioxygenase-like lactoylglutathione lyase family enzyme